MSVLKFIWRLIVMAIGVRIAVFAAAAGSSLVASGWLQGTRMPYRPDQFPRLVERFVDDLLSGGNATALTAAAFGPAVLVALVAEVLRVRNPLYHWIGGAAVALWVVEAPWGWMPEDLVGVAATGLFGGFVYWLIAGRNAGFWRDRPATPAPVPAPAPSSYAAAPAPVEPPRPVRHPVPELDDRHGRPVDANQRGGRTGDGSRPETSPPAWNVLQRKPSETPPAPSRRSGANPAVPSPVRKPVVERTSRWR